MKTSEIHTHILKKLYKMTSAVLFILGIVITVRLEAMCWNLPRIYAFTHYPDEIIVGVIAIIGGFYFAYKVRHYDEDKEGD